MASNTQQQAVAVTEKSIGLQLQNWMSNLRNYAVRKYDAEAWLKTAMLCILESRDLMECMATEAGKRSLYHALRYAATTGLSLNPQEAKACLVPRAGRIVCWIEKAGWVELLMDTGKVERAYPFVVYLNDIFKLKSTIKGDDYEHVPDLDDRGAVKGFVSAILFKDGTSSVHYMTLAQMQKHRDTYGMGLDKPDCAWVKSFEGRALAACAKLHIRRLALAPADAPALTAAAAIEDDDVGPVDWKEIPGVTAAEVETALKQKKTEAKPEPAAEGGKGAAQGAKAAERPVTKTEGPAEDQGLF